jgi:hypothetical protein
MTIQLTLTPKEAAKMVANENAGGKGYTYGQAREIEAWAAEFAAEVKRLMDERFQKDLAICTGGGSYYTGRKTA